MKQLFLIRHPPVRIDAGVCYGRSDVAATPLSVAALQSLRAALPCDAALISSPLSRCRDLAFALAAPGQAPQLDTRWMEMDFGEWELQCFDNIPRALIDAWAAAPWTYAPPGGESAQDMSQRVLAGLHEILEMRRQAITVVAHAGPLRVVMGYLRDLPREQWLAQDCAPCSLTILRIPAR